MYSVEPVISDLRRIVGDKEFVPSSPKAICNLLFITVYMGSTNSSEHTRTLAKNLAAQIGRLVLLVSIFKYFRIISLHSSLLICYLVGCTVCIV